jgi:hypothetical protein
MKEDQATTLLGESPPEEARPYEPPALHSLGSLEELTAGGQSGPTDFDNLFS